jgi:DNA sulfur modification protein DndC
MDKIAVAIKAAREYFVENNTPWIVGYSGGKDSSLVMKILLTALSNLPAYSKKPLRVFYCDTGVEIPVLRSYISKSLSDIKKEGKSLGIDIVVEAIKPSINNHYFVKVIGRGYPPPTNKFRWCTDRLRIDPIQTAIKTIVGTSSSIVVLGTRYDESEERNRILERHATDKKHIFKQSGHNNTSLFCPISEFTTDDVWLGLVELSNIKSIDISKLSNIYKLISGECPIVRLPDTNPCSKGRFGCWTCTVVRQDKATRNLIDNGFTDLQPLYNFRQWLLDIRDNSSYRCTVRRNGLKGLGPFRLHARKDILQRLLETERQSGYKLIASDELNEISRLWQLDETSDRYREDYEGHQ